MNTPTSILNIGTSEPVCMRFYAVWECCDVALANPIQKSDTNTEKKKRINVDEEDQNRQGHKSRRPAILRWQTKQDKTGQSVDKTGQSVDKTGQSVDKTGQSVDKTGQSVDKTGQSVDKTGQSVDKTGQSVDKTGQSVDKTGQSIH